MNDKPSHIASVELAWSVADRLATLPQIVAIVLSGSRATGDDGPGSTDEVQPDLRTVT